VFSTLHTNDSPGAITRLLDMGVEPYLVASSLIGAIAQRLVRRVCSACSEPDLPSADMKAALGITAKDLEDRMETLSAGDVAVISVSRPVTRGVSVCTSCLWWMSRFAE
jgi:type II secretory ATPase GspE/PulE/Tfp pilus assembly ATPase PilB-like protein